jgi:plasmid stability protein
MRYSFVMATIQIRNIPDEVYLTYKRRALRARRSLQEYLLGKLIADARQPTVDEVLDGAESAAVDSVTTGDILEALDRGRAGR